jgi:hypothetical protein
MKYSPHDVLRRNTPATLLALQTMTTARHLRSRAREARRRHGMKNTYWLLRIVVFRISSDAV